MQQPWHENISFKKSQMQNKEQLVNAFTKFFGCFSFFLTFHFIQDKKALPHK